MKPDRYLPIIALVFVILCSAESRVAAQAPASSPGAPSGGVPRASIGVASVQTLPFSAGRAKPATSRLPHAKRAGAPDVDFADVKLTTEQKAKIDQVHQQMKSKMDVVAQDSNFAGWQKSAMIEGLQRMERRQMFEILSPDQQAAVRKKLLAARAADEKERQDQKRKQMEPMPR